MNRIDVRMPLGIQRDLAIVAISTFIWGLGHQLQVKHFNNLSRMDIGTKFG